MSSRRGREPPALPWNGQLLHGPSTVGAAEEPVELAGTVMRVLHPIGGEDARAARQRDIVQTLQRTQQVDVTELAQRFGVSGMTIRRDLAELDEAGQLHRVHGGAVIRRAPAYGFRASVRTTEKSAIARAVAGLIEPGAAVGIDTGTTCHAVASELGHRGDLTVVTNALNAAISAREGGNRVIMTGGFLTAELSLVNPGATQEPPPVHLDVLVLGCGGLSADRGITYFDPAEVEVRNMFIGLADRVVVAADHSKFDHKKAMVLGPLNLIDVLVTDQSPPEPLRTALAAAGVRVVVS
jgi:DeoR/GlpR family transcriptional regulator of sugar metabolism